MANKFNYKTFSECIDAVQSINNLDDLFDLWKNAHEVENDYLYTFPKCPCCGATPNENFKTSFCPDGVTSINGNENNNSEKINILFILKEADTSDNIKNSELTTSNIFWFNNNSTGRSKTLYKNRIRIVLEKIEVNDIENFKFGYMNINKRGGYSNTDMSQLYNYAHKYKEFIKKQIQLLLNLDIPCHIFFCGYKKDDFFTDDFIKSLIPDNQSIYFYRINHLSTRKNEAFKNSVNKAIKSSSESGHKNG